MFDRSFINGRLIGTEFGALSYSLESKLTSSYDVWRYLRLTETQHCDVIPPKKNIHTLHVISRRTAYKSSFLHGCVLLCWTPHSSRKLWGWGDLKPMHKTHLWPQCKTGLHALSERTLQMTSVMTTSLGWWQVYMWAAPIVLQGDSQYP